MNSAHVKAKTDARLQAAAQQQPAEQEEDKTVFSQNGVSFVARNSLDLNIHKKLPAGTYCVRFNSMAGDYYVDVIENFKLPEKLYGDTHQKAERIISTFLDRPAATGVLLTGDKGSGKSLLSKAIAVRLLEMDIPTLVINEPHFGEVFNQFMQRIRQPTAVLFDEFEKVYKPDQQEAILTLLDGMYPSKKLFVITSNDRWRVDSHMRNRPGRLYYSLEYGSIEMSIVRAYCDDNLHNKDHSKSVERVALAFSKFNFDMLRALVEEMNRYDEPAHEALRMLNIKAEYDSAAKFNIVVTRPDGTIPLKERISTTHWEGNPLSQTFGVGVHSHDAPLPAGTDIEDLYMKDADSTTPKDDAPMGMGVYQYISFNPSQITGMHTDEGKFMFTNPETGYKCVLTREVITKVDWLQQGAL